MDRPTVTDEDVGKRVENHNGDQIGVAAAVEDDTVYVEPNPSIVDSIKATLGWETGADDVVPVNREVIGAVTPDAIRLDSELAVQGGPVGTAGGEPPEIEDKPDDPAGNAAEREPATDGHDGVRDSDLDGTDDRDAELAVDPIDVTDPEAELQPNEDVGSRTDASAEAASGRADSSVESTAEPRRTDAAANSAGERSARDSSDERGAMDASTDRPATDAARRPDEIDEFRDASGERDALGEIDEPAEWPDHSNDPDEPLDLPDEAVDIDDLDDEKGNLDDAGS